MDSRVGIPSETSANFRKCLQISSFVPVFQPVTVHVMGPAGPERRNPGAAGSFREPGYKVFSGGHSINETNLFRSLYHVQEQPPPPAAPEGGNE